MTLLTMEKNFEMSRKQQQLYSILYRSFIGLFVIWDALVGLKFNKVCSHESAQ